MSSRRALAWICLLLVSARVVQAAGKPEELRLELTPREVQVNRTLPAFVPASKAQTISDNPSDDEIGILRLFPERLLPINPGKSQSTLRALKNVFSSKTPALTNLDNRHVVSTLRALQTGTSPYDTAHLEAFIKAQPESRWAPAFKHELARRQFKQGWFSQAVAGWDQLWDELKDRRDLGAIEVANEVLSHLLDAYIGLGKAERLATLIGEQESRPGNPVIQAKILRARQAVWLLKHKGAQNVMCGPVALYCILKHNHQSFVPIRLNDITDDYIATGISLSQLKNYSDHYKMGLVRARKSPGCSIPTPAIMHLATGHYSAILDQTNGTYLVEDRPMQFQGHVSLEALEAQGSGYFLIPAGPLPPGWQAVSEEKGSGIFGRDGLHGQEPFSQSCTPCAEMAGGNGGGCCGGSIGGMPTYTFLPQIASLRIEDSPIGYSPPVGPAVFPVIAYNDLDDSKPVGTPMFSNVGRMWSINWIAYAELTWRPITVNGNTTFIPDFPVVVHVPGGGTEVNHSTVPNDRSFARVTISTDGVLCTRTLPDGTRQLFNTGTFLSPTFLDQLIDPSGNTLSFTYDSNLRLVAVKDAIGQVTTLDYTWPGDIRKVTKVTDPFGRFATFSYSGNSNELSSVTDVLGLTTTFSYDTNEFLTSMTTPYGTTTFANTRAVTPQVSYDYALTAIDPQGDREMVRYIEPIAVPSLGPPLPSFINVGGTNVPFIAEDARLNFRNSFYWNKRAMRQGPGDFSVARNYRWLTDGNYLITPILEAIKEPLENRVWFNYPNQVGRSDYSSFFPYYAGEGGLPEKRLRMLSDGTPQLTQTYYNALGHVTNAVDPRGRTTIYNYATNLIDLLEIRQKTGPGASERVAAFTYSSQHLPLTAVDAAGQTNRFIYNTRGQAVTFTNPKGEMTTLSYDNNGYLLSIDGPAPGASDSTSLTYDGFGRVRTITGPDAYYITLDYDAMDRLTGITFPDGSTEQFTYNRLDLVGTRDRMGRLTRYTYNNLGQLLQVQDPLNRITRFGWCECGGLSSVTDPLGRMTSWQYDFQGRVTSKQYADGSKISYNYDRATGQLKSISDEKGQLTVYDYDAADSIVRITYPNAQVPTPTVTFTYDPNYKRKLTMQDGEGTTTWSYYPSGVLGALKTASVAGPWNNSTASYQYDALGRVTSRAINGVNQTWAYDELDRVTNVVNALGSFAYAYDGATTRVLDRLFPNGQTTHYDYFDLARDRRIQHITNRRPDTTIVSRFSYAYNPSGDITNWVQELGAVRNIWNIGYDAADQLISVVVNSTSANNVSYNYSYDLGGNRASETSNAVSRPFNYNSLNQLVAASPVSSNEITYEWDAAGRLAAVTRGASRSEFSYDGLDRRVRIVEKTNGAVLSNSTYLWCGAEICEERDPSGATVSRRFFSRGEAVVGSGGANYYYNRDHLGSIREILDSNASLIGRFGYDPYGRQTVLSGSANASFGFAGYFVHRPTGLNLTWFRALSEEFGRWLSRDPAGEGFGDLNLYEYASNDPIDLFDSIGLEDKSPNEFANKVGEKVAKEVIEKTAKKVTKTDVKKAGTEYTKLEKEAAKNCSSVNPFGGIQKSLLQRIIDALLGNSDQQPPPPPQPTPKPLPLDFKDVDWNINPEQPPPRPQSKQLQTFPK